MINKELLCCILLNRSKVFLSIERLLNVACNYILVVEDGYCLPRHSPPHGSCFHGYQIQIHVTCETNKTGAEVASHSNETFGVIRQKIADKLDCLREAVQVYMNDKIVSLLLQEYYICLKIFLDKKFSVKNRFSNKIINQSMAIFKRWVSE